MNDSALPPLRLGVCGLGYGLYHMQRLLAGPHGHRIEVRALADSNSQRCAAAAGVLGGATYPNLDAMLADAEIEAVALFTPPIHRAEQILKCVRSGRHVMTTKPLELDPEVALAALLEAERLGRCVFLNSPSPVLGEDLVQIGRWRSEHNLGRLIFAQSDCWYRSTEKPDGSWYDDPRLCPGAPIFRLGIYGLNDLAALAGEPVEVQVSLARILTGRPTPDVAQMSVRFAEGTLGCIRATWCCDPIRDNQVSEYVFERGTIRRDYNSRDHRNASHTTLLLDAVDQEGNLFQRTAEISNQLVNSAYRWDLFHQAVRGRTIPDRLSAEQIVAGVRLVGLMKRALEGTGVWSHGT